MNLNMIEVTRIPSWAWLFAFICAVTVLLTGAPLSVIQGMVGVAGAISCLFISQDLSKPTHLRVLLCLAVVGVSWLIFTALLIGKVAMA